MRAPRAFAPLLLVALAGCSSTPPPPLEAEVWATEEDAETLRAEAVDALRVYGEDLDRVLDSNWLARLSPDYRGARELEGALSERLTELGPTPEEPSATRIAWLRVSLDLARAADLQARRILKAEASADEAERAQRRLAARLAASTAERPLAERLRASAEAVLEDPGDDRDLVWRRLGLAFLFTAEATLESLRGSEPGDGVQRFLDYLDNVRGALSD